MNPLHSRTAAFALALAAALLLASLAPRQDDAPEAARAGTYAVDSVHSSVIFRVRHAGVSNFYGRFDSVGGEYTLDLEHPEASSVSLQIDPASVNTGNTRRDDHVRSADFLHVEEHPEMLFESTSVEGAGDDRLKLSGDLTLHGQTRPVSTEIVLVGAGEFMNGYRTGLETTFTFKRSDFGMDKMIGPLGDEITITVSLEAVLQE